MLFGETGSFSVRRQQQHRGDPGKRGRPVGIDRQAGKGNLFLLLAGTRLYGHKAIRSEVGHRQLDTINALERSQRHPGIPDADTARIEREGL